MTAIAIKTIDVSFSNKNVARIVFPSDTDSIETINKSLAIPGYKSLILVLGGADSMVDPNIKSSLTQLFDRGIAKAAIHADALVVDGGTRSGVMQLMGEGLARRDTMIKLVGIAPESLVTYPTKTTNEVALLEELEPNHSHFVLTPGQQWGHATAIFYQLVKGWMYRSISIPASKKTAKKTGKTAEKIPCLALLAGGGATSKNEVMYAVRKNIPLIIIAGSGGLADEIAKAVAEKTTYVADPQIAEVIADGDIEVFQLNSSVKSIERLIIRKLGVDNLLMQAWESFSNFDKNATRQQKTFNRLHKWIIGIGIAGTALVIIQELFKPVDTNGVEITWKTVYAAAIGWQQQLTAIAFWSLHYILLIVPITLTILLTVSSRFKPGNKWLLLRSAAEAIKREIYKYRVRSGAYTNDPEKQLSQAVEDITQRIMRTEVNASAIIPYKGPIPPVMYRAGKGDDGLSVLTPDLYVEWRLGDQINYFTSKSQTLEKQLKYFSYLAYVSGGVGTFLVAVNFQLWLPLTTAIVTAVATYFGYRQTENTLTKYNQTKEDLKNVRSWWYGLKPEEQAEQDNINSLVEYTEQVLQSEMDGWVQQMQNALDNLRKASEKSNEQAQENGKLKTTTQQSNTDKKYKAEEKPIADANKDEMLIPEGNGKAI